MSQPDPQTTSPRFRSIIGNAILVLIIIVLVIIDVFMNVADSSWHRHRVSSIRYNGERAALRLTETRRGGQVTYA